MTHIELIPPEGPKILKALSDIHDVVKDQNGRVLVVVDNYLQKVGQKKVGNVIKVTQILQVKNEYGSLRKELTGKSIVEP
jgi:glycerol dehydrogenase-like iron-containing ADH family enzyme